MFELIYLFVLISFTYNKECTIEDCGPFITDGKNPDHYICSPSSDDTCTWKLLCDYVQKPNSGSDASSFKCSDQPVSDPNKYTCTDYYNSCKEISFCSHTTIPSDEYTYFDCSKYPLKDEANKENMVCTRDIDSDKCIEQYLCGMDPEIKEADFFDCFIYPVTPDKKYTYSCVYDEENENENKCVEKKLNCGEIYKPSDNTKINCQDFEDDENICLDGYTESPMACIQKKKCSKTTVNDLMDQSQCSEFPVSDPEKYSCVKNEEKNSCEEIYYCLKAPKDEERNCSEFIVSEENCETHGCIEDSESETNKCKEELYCEQVVNNNNEIINCENYPVKNKKTHVCIKNKNTGSTPCKEERLCQYYTEGKNDEECRKYYVTKENTACIKNPIDNSIGCIEKELCTTVPRGDNVDCSKYPVSEKNMNTHVCKNIINPSSSSQACEEVSNTKIDCSKAEKGESNEQCSKYKVSDTTKKCIKNPSKILYSGYTVCIEIPISECELKTSGITSEEECNALGVENNEEQKCVKNPAGDNCILLSYCEYAYENSDEDCAKYALKDEEKNMCIKSKYANKCIEVEKIIDEEEEDTTNKIIISTVSQTYIDESTENTDTTTNENSGNEPGNHEKFINNSFYMIFINCFLILF